MLLVPPHHCTCTRIYRTRTRTYRTRTKTTAPAPFRLPVTIKEKERQITPSRLTIFKLVSFHRRKLIASPLATRMVLMPSPNARYFRTRILNTFGMRSRLMTLLKLGMGDEGEKEEEWKRERSTRLRCLHLSSRCWTSIS